MNYKQYIWPVVILIIGVLANTIVINEINGIDRGGLSFDILHYLVPFNNAYSYLAEIFMLLSGAIFILYVIRSKNYDKVPMYILCLGIFQIVRAILLPLTPIASPYPDGMNYGFLYTLLPTGSTFPSGHTGFAFILFFLIENNKKYKMLSLTSGIMTGLFLIISRGHYTIDVVASIMIGYIIVNLVNKYSANPKKK